MKKGDMLQDFSYAKTIDETMSSLKTSKSGLSSKDAEERLVHFGRNILAEERKISPLKIFLNQFKDFIIMILIFSVLISFLLKEYTDAIAILVILVLNSLLGFIQEYNAEKSIAALKKLASQKAVVLRDGRKKEISASELVPGDIIFLDAGMIVPADARLTESINLEIQESALTGESMPVKKTTEQLPENTIIADKTNTAFSATNVTKGRGMAIVSGTGMHTEIGRIAKMIAAPDTDTTPLQKKLKQLGVFLGYIVIAICAIVFIAEIIKNAEIFSMITSLDVAVFKEKAFVEMLINAVSLAVAALPEGLPAIVTISLALGVQRMVKRNALIRKLPAVETLGCINIICTDKTGTLTCNEMTVKKIFVDEKIIEVSGEGYSVEGGFSEKPKDLLTLLKIGALCNDAEIKDGITGDPTEIAILSSAGKASISKEDYSRKYPRVDEIPFESERKIMTTIHAVAKESGEKGAGNKILSCVKGAPDILLKKCSYMLVSGKARRLTDKDRKKILSTNDILASQALRVLGFACREFPGKACNEKIKKQAESELIFVGLQAMIDPPREEAKTAIEKCKSAGIRVVMITGDHKITAVAIAKELGIEGDVMTGDELDKVPDLLPVVERVSIYARVSPEHKLKIVDALKRKGYIVAMTGDGINDAPALKKADMGIAMGVTGTDVAKEASDMVLTDDNFASIVNAVEEGRIIYDNIKKFIRFLLSTNFAEVMTIFLSILMNLPLPLIAIQILWINLATDGLPALALGLEPADKEIMKRKPRNIREHIITKEDFTVMFLLGIVMTAGVLIMFRSYLPDIAYARTMAFTTMVIMQMFLVLNFKSLEKPLYRTKIFSNKYLICAIFISIAMHITILYTPLNSVFNVVPLTWMDWLKIIGLSSLLLIFGDVIKIFAGSRLMKKEERKIAPEF
jgi:Ca2+-transporting ATPase